MRLPAPSMVYEADPTSKHVLVFYCLFLRHSVRPSKQPPSQCTSCAYTFFKYLLIAWRKSSMMDPRPCRFKHHRVRPLWSQLHVNPLPRTRNVWPGEGQLSRSALARLPPSHRTNLTGVVETIQASQVSSPSTHTNTSVMYRIVAKARRVRL